jgi:hypothetical protein
VLLDAAHDVHSQNGEDGVIARIFDVIGTESRQCCEFGAWDGVHFSNTRALLAAGWSGVQIEADSERFAKLSELYADRDDVVTLNAMVEAGQGGLRALLESHGCPTEFDLVSIDIDGLDYDVLETLGVRPRVLCVEVNGGHEPTSRAAVPHALAASNVGQPLGRFVELAKELGYRLVAYTGNAFFIRADLGHEDELPTLGPADAYAEFVEHLRDDEREWLYRVNLGLAPPHHRFGNGRLGRRQLGLGRAQAAKALAAGIVSRVSSRRPSA